MLLALAQAAHAEMTVSQSNDPHAPVSIDLAGLFATENEAIDQIEPGRFSAIVAPPVETRSTKGADVALSYDVAWVKSVPMADASAEFECLARAIYFEARGESIKGQAAVAEVVMNRAASPYFPRTICGVVNQGNGGGCQFSFTCDGRSDAIADRTAWFVAEKIASAYLAGAPRPLTKGATYFHTPAVRPSWAGRFELTAHIGAHYFYSQPVRTAMN